VILSKAHLAVRLLENVTSLQSRSVLILDRLELVQDTLEDVSAMGEETLLNISQAVPFASSEASESLAQVQGLSPLELNLSAISNALDDLSVETESARVSADDRVSNLRNLSDEFMVLNQLASSLLNRSRSIDSEAGVLLERAQWFFQQAQTGAMEANSIINQTEFLLIALNNSLRDTDVLQEGLQSIIDNVNSAERESIDVAIEVSRERIELGQLERDLMEVIESMDRASENLQETLKVRTLLITCTHYHF